MRVNGTVCQNGWEGATVARLPATAAIERIVGGVGWEWASRVIEFSFPTDR
jgi:uncharacterized protein YqfA (UPF0365 family)